jgi:hypothetical protein
LLASYQGTDILLRAAADHAPLDVHFLIMGYPGVDVYQARAGWASGIHHVYRQITTWKPRAIWHWAMCHRAQNVRHRGLGKVLNYMAMSLPTVAFESEVAREYLGDLGVYAQAGDPVDLARALLAVLDDAPRGRALGEALRARAASEFTWQHAGEQIVGVYRQCLS